MRFFVFSAFALALLANQNALAYRRAPSSELSSSGQYNTRYDDVSVEETAIDEHSSKKGIKKDLIKDGWKAEKRLEQGNAKFDKKEGWTTEPKEEVKGSPYGDFGAEKKDAYQPDQEKYGKLENSYGRPKNNKGPLISDGYRVDGDDKAKIDVNTGYGDVKDDKKGFEDTTKDGYAQADKGGFEEGGKGDKAGYEQGGKGYEKDGKGYEKDGKGYEQGGKGYEQDGKGYEQGGKGYEQGGKGYEQGGKGYERGGKGYEQGGKGYEQGGKGYEQGGKGYEQGGKGYEQGGKGYEQGGKGYEQGGKGYEQGGKGYEQGGKGYEQGGKGYEQGGKGYEEGGYGKGGFEEGGFGQSGKGGYGQGGFGKGGKGGYEEVRFGKGSFEEESFGKGGKGGYGQGEFGKGKYDEHKMIGIEGYDGPKGGEHQPGYEHGWKGGYDSGHGMMPETKYDGPMMKGKPGFGGFDELPRPFGHTKMTVKTCNKMMDTLLGHLQTGYMKHIAPVIKLPQLPPTPLGGWGKISFYDGAFQNLKGKICRGGDFKVIPQGETVLITGIVSIPEPRIRYQADAFLYSKLKVRNRPLHFCAKNAEFRFQMAVNKKIGKIEIADLEPLKVDGFHLEDEKGDPRHLVWPFNKIQGPALEESKITFANQLTSVLCDEFRTMVKKPEIKEEIISQV